MEENSAGRNGQMRLSRPGSSTRGEGEKCGRAATSAGIVGSADDPDPSEAAAAAGGMFGSKTVAVGVTDALASVLKTVPPADTSARSEVLESM